MYDSYDSVPRTAGGSRVAAELRRLAASYEFAVTDNVVFTRGVISSVVDHVIVDRYGVLLIDAESHEGASIAGADTDTTWRATFATGQVAEFRNPLYLNTGNENLVKQALADVGVNLEASEIRSAVVFSGADLAHLSLVEVSAAKVKTAETLPELFDARYGSPPNAGRLTGPDIDRIVAILTDLAQEAPQEALPGPWHADPAVTASLGVAMAVPPAPSYGEYTHRLPGELAGRHAGATEGPSMRAALLTLGTILVILLILVAGLVFFPELQAGSVLAWTAALVLFVAAAELVAANIAAAPRNIDRPRAGGAAGGAARLALRLAIVFVLVGGLWLLIAGGAAERVGEMVTSQFDSPLERASQPTNPGVIVAKRRLRETAPQVYKRASNLNTPSIHPQPEGRTSYTWSYTPKASSIPASFTLTIDIEGKVVSP